MAQIYVFKNLVRYEQQDVDYGRSIILGKFSMKIQNPHHQEKRQFRRVSISEPQICQIHVPQSPKLWVNQGIIRNISLGGIFFVCDKELPIEKEDIRDLILDVLYNEHKLYRLTLQGLIVRTEKGLLDPSQFAVAFKFLSDPIYCPLKESNYMEFMCSDKTRILYQHYQLFRKASEIIKKTPEIRPERIDNIRECIDQGLYKIEPAKLAQIFTDNLLKDNIVIHKK